MAYEGGYTGAKAGYTGPGIPDITRVSDPRQPDNNNYLATNYFKFELTRLPLVTYHCQQVNLPSLSLTPVEQPTVFGTTAKWIGGKYTWEELNVSFIVDEDMKNWIEVFEWMEEIGLMADFKTNISAQRSMPKGQFGDYFSDAKISITSSNYKPKLEIDIHGIFPISLGGIQFNSTNPDNEPAIVNATFAYTYYTINRLTNAR
jgi:hypothetical protein